MTKGKCKDQVVDNELLNDDINNCGAECSDQDQVDNADIVSEGDDACDDNSAGVAEPTTDWQDKYLRLVAEFDNYRKRTLREKMDLISSGGEDVIKSLLVVMDDIDRALMAMESAKDIESVKQGVNLIHQKLRDTLVSKGVSDIEAIGLELDTDLHEAVAKFPVEEEKKGKIIDVVQKGYKLKDKVVRFAKVVVGE